MSGFLKVIEEIGPQISILGSCMNYHTWRSTPTRVPTRLQRLPRIIASEIEEHREAGDSRLLRRHSCRLVRPFVADYVSISSFKRHA